MENTQLTLRDVAGPLIDFLTKLLSEEGGQWLRAFKRFLRKENPWETTSVDLPRPWREQDGIIYFSVASDGTTGPQWITRLEKQNFRVSDYAKSVLRSKDFQPTNRITTEIAVLKGELFADSERTTHNIRLRAVKHKMILPNAEVACLIREKFSDQDLEAMGLWWIITMHESINDSGGFPYLLGANRDGGGRWLCAYCDYPGDGWNRGSGFAFAVSQV